MSSLLVLELAASRALGMVTGRIQHFRSGVPMLVRCLWMMVVEMRYPALVSHEFGYFADS